MEKYLVGISYHDPESYESWEKGMLEDYESSTGIFINANSSEEAISWGEIIGEELFKKENPNESRSWKSFEHFCWIEEDWKVSGWEHCFDFFQNVDIGIHPDYEKMGSNAYLKWCRSK
jgi:hypothetical protein